MVHEDNTRTTRLSRLSAIRVGRCWNAYSTLVAEEVAEGAAELGETEGELIANGLFGEAERSGDFGVGEAVLPAEPHDAATIGGELLKGGSDGVHSFACFEGEVGLVDCRSF